MFMNFKTRREARQYAAKFNVPAKEITNTGKGSLPWRVNHKIVEFVADGRLYRLADAEGFIRGRNGTILVTNKRQAELLEKYHPDGFAIKSVSGTRVVIEAHPSVSLTVLHTDEACFFVEVAKAKKPAAKRKPKPVATPEEETVPSVDVDALDAELDTPAVSKTVVPATTEKDPLSFIAGQDYVLVDKSRFRSTYANGIIAGVVERTCGGVYSAGKEQFGGHTTLRLSPEGSKELETSRIEPILLKTERRFFREVADPVAVQPTVVSASAIAQKRQNDQMSTLLNELESAMQEHQDALNSVVGASRKVHDVAIKIAALKA